VPVALSDGSGSFAIHNPQVGDFAAWAAADGVQVLIGDFNGLVIFCHP
jgi:hypothetical protein